MQVVNAGNSRYRFVSPERARACCMPMFTLHCPWCEWFGMTTGIGDDHPADFLKHDFLRHVKAEHPQYEDVAEHMEPEYVERKKDES